MNARMEWSDPALESIAAIVRERAGLVFSPGRIKAVESAIFRGAGRAHAASLAEYAAVLGQGGPAIDDLLADLTVGESYFFREPTQFQYLRERMLPALRNRHGRGYAPRAWSAGCATGEEPYTLAITLLEAGFAARVMATDLSRSRLAQARRGKYRPWSLRGVPDAVVARYFQRHGADFVLSAGVRQAVEFRYLNLARDHYPAISTGIWGMDIVLCRNVLIYFDRDTVTRVATRLLDSLGDDGILLLGASDPPLADLVPCEVVGTGAGMAYRRRRGHQTLTGHVVPRATVAPALPPGQPSTPPPTARARPAADAHTPPRPTSPATAPPTPATNDEQERRARAAEGNELAAYAARDYDRSAELARERLAKGASEPASVLLVRALANLGRLDEAGRACASGLDAHPDSIELLYLHAVLLAQAGRAAESADAARRVLYLDRGCIVAHLALGHALGRLGERTAAARAFQAAERLLAAMPVDALVPASDGEPAGRLLEMARMQHRLLTRSAA